MNKKYDTAVVIGRFQPLHNSHLALINEAAKLARTVVIVLGSANQPRTTKNPWTCKERTDMIVNSIDIFAAYYKIMHNIDTIYDDIAWRDRVLALVGDSGKTTLVGYHKDASSFYLDMFPQWDFTEVTGLPSMDATSIRRSLFSGNVEVINSLKPELPAPVFSSLRAMLGTPEYRKLIKEYNALEEHRKVYAHLPYEPIFVTADAMVLCNGNVLMVKRKGAIGKGLWALPGGYVNASSDKSLQDAAIRELKEETSINIPSYVLEKHVTKKRTFDAIGRSARGRIITTCFKIELSDSVMPAIKAFDDAEEAKWVPLNELDGSMIFEDHYEIIQIMLKIT